MRRIVCVGGGPAGLFTAILARGLTDEGIRARMLRHHERRIELFGRALRTARPDMPEEEVRQRVEGLLAALNGMAFHRLLDPSFDFRSYARALLQIGA